jgi:hypothetical protein
MAFPCAFLLNLHQMDKHMVAFGVVRETSVLVPDTPGEPQLYKSNRLQ